MNAKKNEARLAVEKLEDRQLLAANPFANLVAQPMRPALVQQMAAAAPMKIEYAGALGASPVRTQAAARSLVGYDSTFTISNNSRTRMSFQIKWEGSSVWQSYTLQPGYHQTYYNSPVGGGSFSSGRPRTAQIRFGSDLTTGVKLYALTSKLEVDGRNGPAGPGMKYQFLQIGKQPANLYRG